MGKCHPKKRLEVNSVDKLIEDGLLYLSRLSTRGPPQPGPRSKVIGRNILCVESLSTAVKKKGFYTGLLSGCSSINDRSGADIVEATEDLKNLTFNQLMSLHSKISQSSRTKSTEAACDHAHVGYRQSVERLIYEQLVTQIQLSHQAALGLAPASSPPASLMLPPFAGTRSQTQNRYLDEQSAVSTLTRNEQCQEVGKQILLTIGLIQKMITTSSKPGSNANEANEWTGRYPWRVPLTPGALSACYTPAPATPAASYVHPFKESPVAPGWKFRQARSRAAVPLRTSRVEEIFLEIPTLYIALKLRGPDGGKFTDKVYTHVIEPGFGDVHRLQIEILSYTGGIFKYVGVKASAGKCINELKHVLSQGGEGGGGGRKILKSVSSTRSSQSHCSGVSEVLVNALANLKKRRQSDQENVQPSAATLSPLQDARERTPSEIRLALEAKAASLQCQSQQTHPRGKGKRKTPCVSSALQEPGASKFTSPPTASARPERKNLALEAPARTPYGSALSISQKRKSTIDVGVITPAQRLPTIASVAFGPSKNPTSRINSQLEASQNSVQLTSPFGCPELVTQPTTDFVGRFQTALTSDQTSYRTLTTSNNSGTGLFTEANHYGVQAEYSPPSFCLSRIGSQELPRDDQQQSTSDIIRRSDVYVVKRRDF